MGKGYRAIMIAAAILMGTGIVATAAGLMMGARLQDVSLDERSLSSWYDDQVSPPRAAIPEVTAIPEVPAIPKVPANTHTREWKTIWNESYTDVTSLDLSAGFGEVIIREGDGFAIVTSGTVVEVQSYIDNGEWKIESRMPSGVRWGNNHRFKMTITVPKGWHANEIDIEIGAGSVEAEMLSASEITIEVGAGQIYVERMTSGNTDIDCAMGQVEIGTGKLTGSIEIDCGMGQVNMTIEGKQDDYGYKYSVGMGAVSIGTDSAAGLGAERNHNVRAENLIEADCGMGKISIEFTE